MLELNMITLHFSSNSRSQRVLWLLEELNINYQLNKIKFHPSELNQMSIENDILWDEFLF